jgi:hypothetical protein
MKQAIDSESQRLPIEIDATSNGEFERVPLSQPNRAGNRLAQKGGERQCEALEYEPTQVSRVGMRRGEHAARIQRRQCGGRKARRIF